MAGNFLRILMYPYRFEVWPPCPEVTAAVDPLKVGVIWDNDPGTWTSVTVQNFVDEDGNPVPTIGTNPVFTRAEGNVVKEVHFQYLASSDHYCKFELVYEKPGASPGSTERYTVDPTLMVRRLG